MFARHLLFLLIFPLAAQSTHADLTVSLHDPAGLPVTRATLTLTNLQTGTETPAGAAYRFLALPPGPYELAIEHPGFRPARRRVDLRIGQRAELELTLELAAAAGSSVDVTAAPPLLQSTRGTVSLNVEKEKIETLPLDGRNFIPLIALSPGVSLPPGSFLPRINGGRPRTSEYVYDGVSVLQPEPGQVAFYPIIDAIDEFRLETNSYAAEYGRSNGGVILVSQKTGSNALHGSAFEFFRNEKLNARNLFAAAGPRPAFRRNQYGFVLGGPIRRNKTFFFSDWQATRLRTGVVRLSTIPTLAQRTGQFASPILDPANNRTPFPGNLIPSARFDAKSFAALSRYPEPNIPGAVANNYRRSANQTTDSNQADGRIDHYFNAAHRLFVRYTLLRDNSFPVTPLPDGSGNIASGLTTPTDTQADAIAAEHTWIVSPSSVNQFRFGWTTRRFQRRAIASPVYDITGYQQLGPPASATGDFKTSVTQFIDNFTWIHGAHTLKSGVDIRMQALEILQPPYPDGNFQFTAIPTGQSVASFLLGQVSRYSIDIQPETSQARANIAEGFIQDDWRIHPRLALYGGVRYTLNFPSTLKGDRGAVFNLNTQKLDFRHTARNLEPHNFGPRLGLAWTLPHQAAIRAGYGLTWIEQAGITTPFTMPLFPFLQTLGQQSPDGVNPAFVLSAGPTVIPRPPGPDAGLGQGVFGVQRDNGSGYAQQWNLTLQKQIGSTWSLETGYLGSKLTRLGVPDVNLNQLTVEQLAGPNPAQQPHPFPNYTTVSLYRNNTGHSTYHSVQARLEKRLSAGLQFTLAYTFSKLIDDAGAVFDAAVLSGPVANFQVADSFNKRLEKDVSTGSIPHIFSAGFVYALPKGWRLGGIIRAQSGSPIAVTQATNFNAFAGFGIQRPNRIADPALPAENRTTSHYFNTAAFTQAPQLTLGNSSRNPVIGPGYRTVDLMVGKTFAMTERTKAEFRAEAFNITNTPPLGNPNGNFGAPGFGAITTALDPRVFELVLKLHF